MKDTERLTWKLATLREQAMEAINNYKGKQGRTVHDNGDVELSLLAKDPCESRIILINRRSGAILRNQSIQSMFDAFHNFGVKPDDDRYQNYYGESWNESDRSIAELDVNVLLSLADLVLEESEKEGLL